MPAQATTQPRLPFDPIERAGALWTEHFGDATAMRLATSIMRVQQLLLAELDAALKPYDITFARYEALVLLTFSREGYLPLSKIGERLMVHPTSVTNAIDRLEAQGLVRREPDPDDRRRTRARITDEGRALVGEATKALTSIEFAITGLSPAEQDQAFDLLRRLRASAGDFPERPEPSTSS
ncbi:MULTISPECIES: MarR family winged helix-turn-helix transcriptional regulator [Mumia]|uniref:MarR family winged helix-turn-helix transcriptional regulator n=1 Tax=Mumia TaxID=1546255 RepID=UPI0014221BB7|nr:MULTISPECIES: MarR family transcriptional regulator [unclassified Mumia]QMW66981.1 MarR family transcriptional regulator [Mumia sp. ZJ1417]